MEEYDTFCEIYEHSHKIPRKAIFGFLKLMKEDNAGMRLANIFRIIDRYESMMEDIVQNKKISMPTDDSKFEDHMLVRINLKNKYDGILRDLHTEDPSVLYAQLMDIKMRMMHLFPYVRIEKKIWLEADVNYLMEDDDEYQIV